MSSNRWSPRWRRIGLLALGLLAPPAAAQDDARGRSAAPAPPAVEERLHRLEQQLRVLQRLRELERDSLAAARTTAPAVTASPEGFALQSADGRFALRLRGYFQSDGRFFLADRAVPVTNTFLIRRARPVLEATVARIFEFRIMPDFGGGQVTLFDAYVDARLAHPLVLRVGKFKPPLGLERLQAATDLRFAERGLPTNLVPSRDLGLQLQGELAAGRLAYQLGVFTGAPDLANNETESSDAKDGALRVFVQPFRSGALRGLGIGVAGSAGIERGGPSMTGLPTYRSPGQQAVFRYRADGSGATTALADGSRTRLAPQGYFGTGPVGLLAEYVVSRQEVRRGTERATLRHEAWQVAGSVFVTGEANGFRGVAPRRPLDLRAGTLGAVELAARYGELAFDEGAFPAFADPASSVRRARAWAVGLNWHFARNVKLVLDYERTTFDGGAPAGDREPEQALVTRLQHAF